MPKKAWFCPGCKKLVKGYDIHFWTAQKFCRKCGSLLLLETEQEEKLEKKVKKTKQ